MDSKVSVIIIGCGPAGVAAALTLNNAGLDVTIITKKQSDQRGANEALESLHPGVESILKHLEVEEVLSQSTMGTYTGITSQGIFRPLSNNPNEVWTGFHIARSKFNSFLFDHAKHQGINIVDDEIISKIDEQGNQIHITFISGNTTTCEYIIDASGRSRFLGKKLKFAERFYSPPLTTWSSVTCDIPNSFFESLSTSFIPMENGWTWLAPGPFGQCTWTRLARTEKNALQPPRELSDYSNNSKIKSANVRWRVFRPVSKKGVLLAGDAAGSLDPAAGQGILNALLSGIMAGNTVIKCINTTTQQQIILNDYDNWFFKSFEDKAILLRQYYRDHKIDLFGKSKH